MVETKGDPDAPPGCREVKAPIDEVTYPATELQVVKPRSLVGICDYSHHQAPKPQDTVPLCGGCGHDWIEHSAWPSRRRHGVAGTHVVCAPSLVP